MGTASNPANSDHRKYIRYKLPNGDNNTLLSDGRSIHRVVCLELSAEGFRLSFEGRVPWTVGSTVQLNKEGQWCQVKIMHIQDQGGQSQIGVRWLCDCDPPDPGWSLQAWRWIPRLVGLSLFRNLPVLSVSAVFLLCLGILIIMARPPEWLTFKGRSGANPLKDVGQHKATSTSRQADESPSFASSASRLWKKLSGSRPEPRKRAESLLASKNKIAWSEIERVLDLTTKQSRTFLLLLHESEQEISSLDHIDTSQIVITSGKEFAAFVNSLPPDAFSFLSGEQQRSLTSLLRRLSRSPGSSQGG